MVHAYLMYGFPTQTEQETIDSMEVVRQLFAADLINSAFWHRFVLTRHAPIYREQALFKVEVPNPTDRAFASNDLPHTDPTGAEHDHFDDALPLSLNAWMQGKQLDRPVHRWFENMPPTTEAPDRIERALNQAPTRGSRLLWVGAGAHEDHTGVTLHTLNDSVSIPCSEAEAEWLLAVLEAASPAQEPLDIRDAQEAYPGDWAEFEARWETVRQAGALLI